MRDLESRLARSERTVQALREVGLALGSTLDLDQLLELILKKITDLLEADRATLYLLDEQRNRLLSRIMIGEETRSIELPVGQGIAGHVAKVGQTVRVKDAYRDKRFQREWDELTGYRTRSILAAPMKNHVGRTIGVIQVLNKRGPHGGEFTQHDEELLTALATQAAVSIDNSRLFLSVIQKNMQLVETKEQLEQRVSDLKLLFRLESSTSRADTMEELAQAVVCEAARACQARAGGILVDEGESGVWLYFVDLGAAPMREPCSQLDGEGAAPSGGAKPCEVKRLAVRRGEGIIGRAMSRNEAVSIASASDRAGWPLDGEGPVSARLAVAMGITVATAIAVPLEGEDDQPIGAIALYNSSRPGGFTQDDRALLRLVSANASTAVRLFFARALRERSERLTEIGRVVAGVIHDVRTPLTVIGGYVQLMAAADDAAARAEQARLIAEQFDRIVAMQREVLEFARGEKNILRRRVYLVRFFEQVEKEIEQQIAGTKIRLAMEVEDRGAARFDEAKIARAIHNLVRNAIDAMADAGGMLTVRAWRDGGDLCISVADTGKGIPKEVQGRLFQWFVTSGKRRGTGLGLGIVKKIVDEHDGTIAVASSEKGTSFTMRLPQETTPAPATVRPEPVARPESGPLVVAEPLRRGPAKGREGERERARAGRKEEGNV